MNIFITGGTGTLGNEIIRQIHNKHDITVYSRDELKQKLLSEKYPDLTFKLGSIEDRETLTRAMRGHGVVFHLAALKHIDWLEKNPDQALAVNAIGTKNVVYTAKDLGIERLAFSSSDKAVDPINAYGFSKALGEKIVHHSRYLVFRWGNIVGSRGSVIPTFVRTINEECKVYLTHSDMTRFWLRIEDAAKFMIDTTLEAIDPVSASPGYGLRIPPVMKAAPVWKIAKALGTLICPNETVRCLNMKIRPGEKLHERLISACDGGLDSSQSDQYTDEELLELLKDMV